MRGAGSCVDLRSPPAVPIAVMPRGVEHVKDGESPSSRVTAADGVLRYRFAAPSTTGEVEMRVPLLGKTQRRRARCAAREETGRSARSSRAPAAAAGAQLPDRFGSKA